MSRSVLGFGGSIPGFKAPSRVQAFQSWKDASGGPATCMAISARFLVALGCLVSRGHLEEIGRTPSIVREGFPITAVKHRFTDRR